MTDSPRGGAGGIVVDATGLDVLRGRFSAIPEGVAQRLRQAVERQAAVLVADVQEGALGGQVLRDRGGGLRAAIRGDVVAGPTGASATVGVAAGSPAAAYAAFWENGFHGTESVRACLRTITQAFGRTIAPVRVMVRAHDRRVDVAARPFLRPALEENRDAIVAALTAAVQQGVSAP